MNTYTHAFAVLRANAPAYTPFYGPDHVDAVPTLIRCMKGWLSTVRRSASVRCHVRAGYRREVAEARAAEMASRIADVDGALATITALDFTLRHVVPGTPFTSRTGARYVVDSLTDRGGFTARRIATDSLVNVSGALIARVHAGALAGQSFAYQKSGKQGGISYTVAVEAGVVFALRDLLNRADEARCFRATGGAA